MLKKLVVLVVLGVTLSGCFISPLALVGPATSGFSTASLIQSSATTTANFFVKKTTGKTVARHVYDAISRETIKSSYLPFKIQPSKIKIKFIDWLKQLLL